MLKSNLRRLVNYLKFNWINIILIVLAIYDLRIDIRLLFDFFTFSTLFYTIYDHPLAIAVLLIIPGHFKYSNKIKQNK